MVFVARLNTCRYVGTHSGPTFFGSASTNDQDMDRFQLLSAKEEYA